MDILLTNVSCMGSESSLLNCIGNTSSSTCESLEDAALVCQGNCKFRDSM